MNVVARNRKALHDYEIIDRIEAGIELLGTEIKAVRAGHLTLSDCYAQCINGQMFLTHLHIGPYEQANLLNHEPYRRRRLLLRRREIRRLAAEISQKKLALVPLQFYFKKQWLKVELGLGRGRRKYDKRQKILQQQSSRRIAQVMAEARRTGR